MTFEIAHLKNKVYYSQNREDLLLEAFFPDTKNGFYVDIGAYDPDYDSVTKLFYKKGWNGINVEPQLSRYEKFVKVRSQDVNLNCGVSDKKGSLTLRAYKNGGLSTFSDEIKDSYNKEPDPNVSDYEDVKVPVLTLKDIFKEHAAKTINFMKVDVEGLEYEVLAGNDWDIYRPQVLCIEANHIIKDWKELIKKNGYTCVFFDGLNEYYVDTRDKTIRPFDYVNHILTIRGGGIAYGDYKDVKNLNDQSRKDHQDAMEKIALIQTTANQRQEKIDELEALLNNPRILARKLAKLIARRTRDLTKGSSK
jgi:FkbM family methyltransferase